jgi:hypothetical protein
MRRPEGVEHTARLGGDALGRGEQHRGVEVALQRHLVAGLARRAAADVQRDRPVHADGVRADGGECTRDAPIALAEQDHRHACAVALAAISRARCG